MSNMYPTNVSGRALSEMVLMHVLCVLYVHYLNGFLVDTVLVLYSTVHAHVYFVNALALFFSQCTCYFT
jgi:hypothetical protein